MPTGCNCAQAMALEEMLVCSIPRVLYSARKAAAEVALTEELRQTTQKMADEMHRYFCPGLYSQVKARTHCNACSSKSSVCRCDALPEGRRQNYLRRYLDETATEVTPCGSF